MTLRLRFDTLRDAIYNEGALKVTDWVFDGVTGYFEKENIKGQVRCRVLVRTRALLLTVVPTSAQGPAECCAMSTNGLLNLHVAHPSVNSTR
jgi:hypothetical protein